MEVLWQSRLCQVSTRVAWKSTGRKERRKEHGNLLHKKRNFFFCLFFPLVGPTSCGMWPNAYRSLRTIPDSNPLIVGPTSTSTSTSATTTLRPTYQLPTASVWECSDVDAVWAGPTKDWVTDVKILTAKFDVVWLEGRWEKFENDSQKCGPDCTGPNGCIIYSCQREIGTLIVDGPT